jgi:V8-like Glu-specific endopeptidase
MKNIIFLVLAFLVNSCFVKHVPNYSSREVISQAIMATFKYIEDGNRKTNMASAFALDDTYILTAGHFCVSAFEQAKEKDVVLEVVDKNDRTIMWGKNEIIWISTADLDYCIIEKVNHNIEPFPIYKKRPHVGDKLASIGAPTGIFPTRNYGEMINLDANRYKLGDLYVANLSSVPGSSGSPVINEEGKVVGMIISMLERNHSINFITPIIAICKDIKESLGIECN